MTVAAPLSFPIATDAYLDSRSSNVDRNYGGATTVKALINASDASVCRGLFRLPPELALYEPEEIAAANVYFYVWQDNTADRNVTLYPLTRDFAEGAGNGATNVEGATWQTCDGTNAWTAPGGDYDAAFPVVGVKEAVLDPDMNDRFFRWDLAPLLAHETARANRLAHGARLMIDEEPVPATGMPRAPFTSSDDLGYAPAYRPHLDLQVILRTPVAPQIVVSNGVVTMDLAGCTPYVTNRIERTFDLAQTNGWSWVADLVTTGAVTNWAETLPAEATNAFYRVKIAE